MSSVPPAPLETAIRSELGTWRAAGPAGWRTTSELLAHGLAGVSLLYQPAADGRPHRVLGTHGVAPSVAESALKALKRELTYDPAGVPQKDRNRVSLKDDLVRNGDFTPLKLERWWHVTRDIFGRPIVDQLRLLICEGPTALAWVGAVQFDPDRPFTAVQRRLMQRLAPAFIERVQLEARLDREPLVEATLDALLAQAEQPAWLLDARGVAVLSNPAATARWDRAPTDTARALAQVAQGPSPAFRVAEVRVPGLPRYQVVMARGEFADVGSRLKLAAGSWALTSAEATVLACVLRGLTTAAIATELRRSSRAVELYLTRLMKKARVDNRASLIAKVWAG